MIGFPSPPSYGTIVCDFEQRRIVTLLPDREIATVEVLHADHPEIESSFLTAVAVMAKRQQEYRPDCLACHQPVGSRVFARASVASDRKTRDTSTE